jgi:hypothetical protein
MADRPTGIRAFGLAILAVCALRLLAWGAPAEVANAGISSNQTVPTFTPTPGPPTAVTDLPTSTPTTAPGPTLAPTPDLEPTSVVASPEATAVPGTVLPPTGSRLPEPGGATALATSQPDAVLTATAIPQGGVGPTVSSTAAPASPGQATVPAWTPAVVGGGSAPGLSCLWPAIGLLLVLIGLGLLAWRRRDKARAARAAGGKR